MRAAIYTRFLPDDEDLPERDDQLSAVARYVQEHGYEVVARYDDGEAPGAFLYHKPALRAAIKNVQEDEDWEVLVAADPRCFSETESARHELVHKFALYGNRIECPGASWEELESQMRSYRRKMAGK